MAVPSIRISALAMLIMTGILFSGDRRVSADCFNDVSNLIAQCLPFVVKSGPKVPPSTPCCGVVRNADMSCVCKNISKELELVISIDKLIYVAQFCGKPIPPGSKCGSVTVPPLA